MCIVHPATWFKVEFADRKIATFRPSALQPVDEEGNPFETYVVKPSVSRATKERGGELNNFKEATRSANSGRKGRQLLSTTDPDLWVGKKVVIVTGRHSGYIALVKSSGNGWVQLDTPQGEIAKRAYELELIPDGEDEEEYLQKTMRKHAAANTSAASNSTTDSNTDNGSARDELNDSFRRVRPQPSASLKPGNISSSRSAAAANLPIRNPAFSEARRAFIAKYVANVQQKIEKRPNLVEWKWKLNEVFNNTRVYELQAARQFDDSFCSVCCLERLPATKFCWNEACPISPVYYKLTGAEKPKTEVFMPEVHIIASRNEASDENKEETDADEGEDAMDVPSEDGGDKPEVSMQTAREVKLKPVVPMVNEDYFIPRFTPGQINPIASYLLNAPSLLIGHDRDILRSQADYFEDERLGYMPEYQQHIPAEFAQTLMGLKDGDRHFLTASPSAKPLADDEIRWSNNQQKNMMTEMSETTDCESRSPQIVPSSALEMLNVGSKRSHQQITIKVPASKKIKFQHSSSSM